MRRELLVPLAVTVMVLPGCSSDSKKYADCEAVRAAGKAPLHKGDPGYSKKLDRDGDGVACT